ncbi:hypothetical protein GCU56_13260 [Geodermatophilus sabuli]|uniref:Uncharacterized protein n=1 Tax=Geodermatophilus sabuli TaxID=1564158 RepID=A0A7K3W1T1_9ACTN|nr:hypothetical protein [Geodermatophilus sabuli]NEK58836.1 hypothetical protein [Geodermatophilus sabuli]
MRLIRLIWVTPYGALSGVEAEVDDAVLVDGTITAGAGSDFPGPPGRYRLLGEELWRTMEPNDPAPAFLHESYEALLEKWVNSLPDAAVEVTIVARVRDAVRQLVETDLSADPQAISASPTVTTTEPTPQGMAVIGRSVVLRPSRSPRRSTHALDDAETPGRPVP